MESYPAQWYSEFLIMTCRIAQGDFDKKIDPAEVWLKLGMEGVLDPQKDTVVKNIVRVLESKSYVRRGANENEIFATEEGVAQAVRLTKEPYTNFGLLSPQELSENSKIFVYRIYNETQIRQRPIPFTEIQNIFGAIPHKPALINMIVFYHRNGWIGYDENRQLISRTPEGLAYAGFSSE